MNIKNIFLNIFIASTIGALSGFYVYSLGIVDLKIVDSLCWNILGVVSGYCFLALSLKDVNNFLKKG